MHVVSYSVATRAISSACIRRNFEAQKFCAKLNNWILHLFIHKTTPCNNEITVDGERFAGLNIGGFSAIEFFTEIV